MASSQETNKLKLNIKEVASLDSQAEITYLSPKVVQLQSPKFSEPEIGSAHNRNFVTAAEKTKRDI